MKPIEISKDIYWIGVNDEKTILFEGLWPIEKEGISYNSYLIKDEKNVLIDLCKDIYQQEYLDALKMLVDPSQINYLVVNHMEPDHSGALLAFRQLAPQAVILTTQKAVAMLDNFFGIRDGIRVVADGEEISIGVHHLQFISAPMVHWPETMMTFEQQTGILFSCDAFGGYGRLTDGIFDTDYADRGFFEKESLRYFANIVAAFSKPVLNAGEKLSGLPIRTVAPSHGLIWKQDPMRIVELYLKWSGYSKGKAEPGVTLLHGSMYGNTDRMVEAVAAGLEESGVPLIRHDVTQTHISTILPSLWVNQGVMIGAPTYEGMLFPTMSLVLHIAEYKRIFNRTAAYFGSYGWGGGATRLMNLQLDRMKWQLTDTLEFPGSPEIIGLEKGRHFGRKFGDLIRSM